MNPEQNKNILRVGEEQIALLSRLCEACAVSGDEGAVRKIVLEALQDIPCETKVDALGNVLAVRQGQGENRLRVMLAAHMDEIGFMITAEEGDGLYRFDTVGGIDERQLVGKPVWIGKEKLPGVIGAKPIHLTTADERKRAIPLDSLRIDVGPGNGAKVKVGERATFATKFTRLGESVLAKALDDRLGVATLIQLLRHAPENIDLLAAFTVQEEVGLRGARVAAYALDPDLAIAVDSTPAYDLPAWHDDEFQVENANYNTRLDAGPAIYIADAGTLSNRKLIDYLAETGERNGIPYQFRQPGGGGTDAGAIHLVRAGVPSGSVSIPGRYAHTAAGLTRIADWENTILLLHTALAGMSREHFARG